MDLFWHHSPLARAVIPLICGVTAGMYLPVSRLGFYFVFSVLVLIIAIYFLFLKSWRRYKNRFIVGGLINLGLFFAGLTLIFNSELLRFSNLELPPKADLYEARLSDYPEVGKNSVRLDLTLLKTIDSSPKICKPVRMYGYVALNAEADTLLPGDIIVFRGHLMQPKEALNPGQFDYANYLRNQGIAASTFVYDIHALRPQEKPFNLRLFFKEIQNYGVEVFSSYDIPRRELGVASALILGKRSLIDPNLQQDYIGAGVVHVLSVSGLHVGIIYLVILLILNRIFKDSKRRVLKFFIIALLLVFYAGITGFSSPVLRATIMFIFVAAGRVRQHRSPVYNALAASAIFLILFDPSVIREVGFQLSYCAVLGIVTFYKPIYERLIFKSVVADKIWSLIVISIAAQLATFPLSIYYFGQFPNYFLLTNLIVIPLASVALYSGLVLIGISWIPVVSNLVASILSWSLWSLNTFVEWISDLPLAVSDNLHFSLIVMLLLYGGIVLSANIAYYPSRRNLYLVLATFISLICIWNLRTIQLVDKNQIVILKGYKGDAICFQSGGNALLLIGDTSRLARSKNAYYFSGFFNKAGIDHVEWLPLNGSLILPNMVARNGYLSFDSYQAAAFGKKTPSHWLQTLPCRFILINAWGYDDSLHFENNPPLVVLSSALWGYQRKKLLDELSRKNLSYWDMKTQGAYFAQTE